MPGERVNRAQSGCQDSQKSSTISGKQRQRNPPLEDNQAHRPPYRDQAQLSCHDWLVAQRAGCAAAQLFAPVCHEVLHDAAKAVDVAAGRDLGAQRWALQADGALDGCGTCHVD
jgi:hypothetical protein